MRREQVAMESMRTACVRFEAGDGLFISERACSGCLCGRVTGDGYRPHALLQLACKIVRCHCDFHGS